MGLIYVPQTSSPATHHLLPSSYNVAAMLLFYLFYGADTRRLAPTACVFFLPTFCWCGGQVNRAGRLVLGKLLFEYRRRRHGAGCGLFGFGGENLGFGAGAGDGWSGPVEGRNAGTLYYIHTSAVTILPRSYCTLVSTLVIHCQVWRWCGCTLSGYAVDQRILCCTKNGVTIGCNKHPKLYCSPCRRPLSVSKHATMQNECTRFPSESGY